MANYKKIFEIADKVERKLKKYSLLDDEYENPEVCHTIYFHVDQTEKTLFQRVDHRDVLSATSFFDLETADQCIKDAIFGNDNIYDVAEWLESDEMEDFPIVFEYIKPVGYGYIKENRQSLMMYHDDLDAAIIVLKKKMDAEGSYTDFYVLTAYPVFTFDDGSSQLPMHFNK